MGENAIDKEEALEIVKNHLLAGLKLHIDDRHFIDLISWYCKALSSSGQNCYKPTVEKDSTARTAS